MSTIRFLKHKVTNGTHSARVWYSLDNHVSRKPCVTIYAKRHEDNLTPIFGALTQNDTELQSDYFEKDRVRLFEDNPLYVEARTAAMLRIVAPATT